MAQLRRGARQQLDYLYADLAAMSEYAVDNPAAVQKLIRRVCERLESEIEPRLQRAEPTVEERLRTVEEKLERLMNTQKAII